jgi:hypothetical protein
MRCGAARRTIEAARRTVGAVPGAARRDLGVESGAARRELFFHCVWLHNLSAEQPSCFRYFGYDIPQKYTPLL